MAEFSKLARKFMTLAIVSATLFFAAGGGAFAAEEKTYLFGFDPRASAVEDARQYLPFVKYVSQATGLRIKLRFTGKGAKIEDLLARGEIDFAAVGAVSYIRADQTGGAIPLVRGLNEANQATYRSFIVVPPGSALKSVDALVGTRFAFGGRSSTQGHLIPRGVLRDHGIKLADLASYEYTGSHQSCANAVISGKADACGMQDTMARALAKRGALKILHESVEFPSSGIAARRGLPEAIWRRVQEALLAFDPKGKHAKGLYHWARTEMPNGFVAAQRDDYARLRVILKEITESS